MKPVKLMVIGLVLILFLILMALFVLWQADKNRAELPLLYEVPEFTFTESKGKPFGLSDMKGKISIVDFIFTRCPGPCPMMSSRMAEFYEMYDGYPQVRFVSFTVDPDHDSLSVLRAYAESYGVRDDRWIFVRAEKPEVEKLYEQGFKLGGELPADHSTKFILVDGQGMIRGYYSTEDDIGMSILKSHLRELVKKSS